MGYLSNPGMSEHDEHFLRRSFEIARRAMTHGNHPFGAILVDQDRNVLIEAENGYMPAHDGTAHAERLLASQACTTLSPDVLGKATLYSSAEPCAMCAGAIYWAGIGRLVYGLSEHRLRDVTGNHPENPRSTCPAAKCSKAANARPRWSDRCWRTKRKRCTTASGGNNHPRIRKMAPRVHRGAIVAGDDQAIRTSQ